MGYNYAPVCTCERTTDIRGKKIDTPLSYNLEFFIMYWRLFMQTNEVSVFIQTTVFGLSYQ